MSKNKSKSEIPTELEKYVIYNHGSYAVRNNKNNIMLVFGRYGSQDLACAAANLLIKHDWHMASVKDDPISEFNDIFWVFKVMNNKLIFDSNFDSFESAVEYLEINSKCNDYNNDLLRKKKRKRKYDDSFENFEKEHKKISNIFSKDDKFVVKYKSQGKKYGIFDSIDEAIVAKQLLINNNWHFSDSVEIEFYNSLYWVFDIEMNFLRFIDKFESYEDALDCADLYKNKYSGNNDDESVFGGFIRKIDDDYIEDIKNDDYVVENNFKKSIDNDSRWVRKYATAKSSGSHEINVPKKPKKSIKFDQIDVDKYDVELLKSEIMRENLKIKELEESSDNDLIKIFENLNSKLDIIYFKENTLQDYFSVKCLPDGEFDFSISLYDFVEFKYIWKLISFYEGNMNKINEISSIHYFNNYYYIIKVFDNKLIVSGLFNSYSEAEDNIELLYKYYSKSFSENNYLYNIERMGNSFRSNESHHGKTFEFEGFRSLEELIAVIDIFNYYDWDSKVFKDNDIFYYHGMYWIIDYFFYYVKLAGRFNSKDEAIDFKCK